MLLFLVGCLLTTPTLLKLTPNLYQNQEKHEIMIFPVLALDGILFEQIGKFKNLK